MNINDFQLLSCGEVRSLTSLGRDKVYNLMRSKGFPSIKIGGTYYVSASNLAIWLERNAGKEYNL